MVSKTQTSLVILVFVAIFFFTLGRVKAYYEVKTIATLFKQQYDSNVDSYRMQNNLSKEEFGITGIYKADKYYCVWVKDRNTTQINSTETHEACHHLVYQSYEHFCK